jgi:molybdenum cofactor cytidylyltransferase
VIAGAILAAGEGRRFGAPKQLAELEGRPLLEHAIRAMVAVPAIERIVVVLGSHADLVRERVDFQDTEPLVCTSWRDGLSASLRCAAAELVRADAIVVTLGDQPFITPQVIAGVLDHDSARAAAVRATYGGAPGHPVLIKRRLFGALGELRGDRGARDVLTAARVREWECSHLCRHHDIDTPADLEVARREAGAVLRG